MIERFRSSQGDFAACGRRVTLPTAAKSPKRRRGLLRGAPFRCSKSPTLPPLALRAISPCPGESAPDPITGGCPPGRLCIISGAQNLSGPLNSRRATGPWVCKNCRRCGSTPAPGFPSQRHRSKSWRAGLGPAPTKTTRPRPYPAVGAGPRPPAKPSPGGRPIPPVRGKWLKAKRGRGAGRQARRMRGPAPITLPLRFPVGAAHWAARV